MRSRQHVPCLGAVARPPGTCVRPERERHRPNGSGCGVESSVAVQARTRGQAGVHAPGWRKWGEAAAARGRGVRRGVLPRARAHGLRRQRGSVVCAPPTSLCQPLVAESRVRGPPRACPARVALRAPCSPASGGPSVLAASRPGRRPRGAGGAGLAREPRPAALAGLGPQLCQWLAARV